MTAEGVTSPGDPVGSRTEEPAFEAAWRADQAYLVDLAYRVLGDIGTAEDVVQESFVRLARTAPGQVRDTRGWLTVVCSRLCLDHLRSARVRRESPHEPFAFQYAGAAGREDAVGPADRVTLDDEVQRALQLVVTRLAPAERVAFVMHDVFAVPFPEIAATLGKSPAACRQLASRARRRVTESAGDHQAVLAEARLRPITAAFLRACANGDLPALTALLHPEVWGTAHLLDHDGVPVAPASGQTQHGPQKVGRTLLRFFGDVTLVTLPASAPGAVVLRAFRHRQAYAVLILTTDGSRVRKVEVTADPGKLREDRAPQPTARPGDG